jgi:hypothetical protein
MDFDRFFKILKIKKQIDYNIKKVKNSYEIIVIFDLIFFECLVTSFLFSLLHVHKSS